MTKQQKRMEQAEGLWEASVATLKALDTTRPAVSRRGLSDPEERERVFAIAPIELRKKILTAIKENSDLYLAYEEAQLEQLGLELLRATHNKPIQKREQRAFLLLTTALIGLAIYGNL